MRVKPDWYLIKLMIKTQIYADSTNIEIIEVIRAKYPRERYPNLSDDESSVIIESYTTGIVPLTNLSKVTTAKVMLNVKERVKQEYFYIQI